MVITVIISFLLIIANILLFVCSAKIIKKEYPDQYDYEHELGLELQFHHGATLIQVISLVLALFSIKLVFKDGFYWNPLFGWANVLILFIISLIILYFFRSFSEDKYEKAQGYISILHLAIIAILSIIAAYIR